MSGMKIHECSCSFVFAVFNNLNGTRVRVRSCSIFHGKNVFVFVRVRHFSEKCVFVFGIFTKSTRSCSVRVHVRVRYSVMKSGVATDRFQISKNRYLSNYEQLSI